MRSVLLSFAAASAIVLGATAATALPATATVAMKQAATTQLKGPKPGTYGRHAAWPAPKAVPLPTSGPPGSCGPWAGTNSTQARTVASHGQITSCFLVGKTWVVTTTHSSGPPEIGTLYCGTNATCLNGWATHQLTAFTWHIAPAGAMLRLLHLTGSSIQFYDGQNVISFNTQTRRFAR
jgi:hypothetical protein